MPRIRIINYIKSIVTIQLALFSIWGVSAQVCTDDLTENNWNNSWVSCKKTTNPNPDRPKSHWLLYEFDDPQSIDLSHIWNANRKGESTMGIKEAFIDYSVDGTTWISLGAFTFPKGTEKDTYEGINGPDFGGVFVEKILITVTQTHGNAECASLAEVKFNINREACYGQVDACGVCNGEGQSTWYMDQDGDGLGDAENTMKNCEQPVGFVSNADDECDTGVVGWPTVGKIFQENGCTGCHGNNAAGGLNLTTYAAAVLGGNKCGVAILTGTTWIDIIMTDDYAGCGTPFIGPSMNDRVGGNIDASELALIKKWLEDGAPEDCSCPAGAPDKDNDGFCDAIDQCPDIDNALIGTPCNDGLACTTDDVWQEDCNCKGKLIDRDQDGVCDTDDLAPDNPCTADGVVDGIEPEDWVAHPDNDCDLDKISVAGGDLNDFSACVDKVGTLMTAECNCGNNSVAAGGVVIDFVGMSKNEAAAANGLPDGLFTTAIDNNEDTLVIQFPFMELGEEICLTVGFSSGNGQLRMFLNNRLMTFTGVQALNNYQSQEFCFKTLNAGTQTLLITENGPGNLRVDGSTYAACPCDGGDITNVACLANFSDIGWRELNNCSLEICEGQPLILGTDRYETISYQWKGPNGLSTQSSTLSFAAVKPSDSGVYWIYYQNNSGCDLIKVIELNVLPAPPVTARIKHPACGLQNGEIILTFTDTPNRANIEFSIDGENGNYVKVADNLGRYIYSNLSDGRYDVWAKWSEGDCAIQLGVFSLEIQPPPTVEAGPDQVICEGQSVTLKATATGNKLTYLWSNGKKSSGQNVTPIPDTYADQTFTYRVSVTDENGCTVKDKVSVKVNSKPKALVNLVHPDQGLANGSITFSFADHPTHKNMEISLSGELGDYRKIPDDIGRFIFKNLPQGAYNTWIRWGGGACPVNMGIIRLKYDAACPEIAATISSGTICVGESVKLSVTRISGATYAWSNGATTYTQTVTPSLRGYEDETVNYSVTVTDRNGCSRTDAVKLKVLSLPQASISLAHAHCDKADGSITLSFKNHPQQRYMEFSINGKNGKYRKVSDETKSLVFGKLTAGKYDVWARWGVDKCPVNLGKPELNDIPGPQINLGPDRVICEGSSITLRVPSKSGWKYLWSNGVKKYTQTIRPVLTSYANKTLIYKVRVEDKYGCVATDEIKVTVSSKPKATTVLARPHCGKADGSITFRFKNHPQQTYMEFSIDGKNGKYRKVKDDAGSFAFTKLPAGKYDAWVRWADDSCPVSLGRIVLEDIPGPQISAGPDQVVCEGAVIRLKVAKNSSWTYKWSNRVTTYSQSIPTKLKAYANETLIYRVTVTDRNKCASVDEVKVTVLSKPRAKATPADPQCGKADGSITFSFTDHPDQSYLEFSINGQEGPYIRKRDDLGVYKVTKLAPGTYDLWVRWRNGSCPVSLGKVKLVNKNAGCSSITDNVASMQENTQNAPNAVEEVAQPGDPERMIRKKASSFEHPVKGEGLTQLQVYPNPAKAGNFLNVRYYTEQVGKPLKIVDPTGRIIREVNAALIAVGWNELRIDLEHLATGTYFVIDGYGNYKPFVIIE